MKNLVKRQNTFNNCVPNSIFVHNNKLFFTNSRNEIIPISNQRFKSKIEKKFVENKLKLDENPEYCLSTTDNDLLLKLEIKYCEDGATFYIEKTINNSFIETSIKGSLGSYENNEAPSDTFTFTDIFNLDDKTIKSVIFGQKMDEYFLIRNYIELI